MEKKSLLLAAALSAALTACGGSGSSNNNNDNDNDNNNEGGDDATGAAFEMQLLHFADVDGNGGVDDADNFSALVKELRGEQPEQTLLVSSGDNLIPGPEFFAASDDGLAGELGEPGNGRANIAWLNAMDVAASVIGNHDLDAGTEAFTELLQGDGAWPGAQFPYLSANTDFTADANADADPSDIAVADGQPAQPNSVSGSATVEVDGETIGLVGASVPTLPSITSTGGLEFSPASFDAGVAGDLDALAQAIQPTVDALVADGVDKIVLLAHMQQIAIEKALATRLDHVDIIVAGGSNTILADGTDTLRSGDVAADTYPLEFTAPNGDPVLVVNTAGDFRYLGRLVVGFDASGVVLPDTIDPQVSGAYATDSIDPSLEPIEAVADITSALESVLLAKDGNVFGLTDVYIDGRRGEVRTEETNLGNLTADANLWLAQQADGRTLISLKNGGGIRSAIGREVQPPGSNDPDDLQLLAPAADADIGKPAGGISQLDLETALRFNNGLTLLTVTAAELADIMEHAVAGTADGATPGQFPQVAGLRFSFDPSMPARPGGDTNQGTSNLSRLQDLAVVDDSGAVIDRVVANGMLQGTASRTFRLVILDFIAKCVGAVGESCGDGYPLKGLSAPERQDIDNLGTDPGKTSFASVGSEQDALAEYLARFYPVDGVAFGLGEGEPLADSRIQNLGVSGKTATVFDLGASGSLAQIGRFASGAAFDEGGAEIVAHDSASQQLFVINSDAGTIDVLDFSDPTSLSRTTQLDPVADVGGTVDGVNSVAVSSTGLVAAALEDATATNDGKVAFYDAASGNFLGSANAGPLPDMVAFTPDGSTLLVANEAEVPEDANNDELRVFSADVPGSVSVIDLSGGVGGATENRLGFADFNSGGVRADELPDGVRINPNATSVANDLEPEYITVAEDGSRAVVSLQENNALAEIDLSGASPSIARIVALGRKNHAFGFNALDLSDADGGINVRARANVRGLYMPDSIDTYSVDGKTYVVTANEGDGRGEATDECAIKDDAGGSLMLDVTAFPAAEQTNDNLGEIGVSCDDIGGNQAFAGDTDSDGVIDTLRVFGARSLSIVELDNGVVGDSGDDFERVTAHLDRFGSTPFIFNDDNDDDSPDRDGRSDAKGPEPEGVVIGVVGGRPHAFVGLERVGGIMMVDVSNPRRPRFVDYINNRDFTVSGADLEAGNVPLDSAGDWGPEGLVFIPAADSPNSQDLLVVGNEVTGTTTVYSVSAP